MNKNQQGTAESAQRWARMNRAAIFTKRADHPCFNKKREYKNEVRSMLKSGKVNLPTGRWVTENSSEVPAGVRPSYKTLNN